MIIKRFFLIMLAFLFLFLFCGTFSAVENTVVWSDDRYGGEHVYYKNLETSEGSRVSWVDSLQEVPDISGSTVVWMDLRDGGHHVYYKNLETGECSRVSWVDSSQEVPVVSGNTVVWEDDRDGGCYVYYKDLETGEGSRVSWVDSAQTNPKISGSTVVWSDDRDGGSHVYYKDLETGQGSRVSWVDSTQSNPKISGSTVVWSDDRDGGSHVYYKNLDTGECSRVSWINSLQENPSVSGTTVVWEDDRDGGSHVFYKDLETKLGSRVSWVGSDQWDPDISGSTVVWTDDRDSGSKLYYKNLETGLGTRVSWVNSVQTNPAISLTATSYNTNPPSSTVKLTFIHHSCGSNWLANGNGNLGAALNANNYYVTETYYGWDAEPEDNLGDSTDTDDWPLWFNDVKMPYVYDNNYHYAYTNTITNPGGENEIIMFKSCYPCSEVGSSIDDEKAIYNSLKTYFAAHPDKLFVLITPPGETNVASYELTRELCNWLVDKETGWLAGYTESNVFVFDFYGVLSEVDSHHRYTSGSIEHVYASDYDGVSPYHNGDNHPNALGNQKATSEFITLLNIAYNQLKG